MIGFAAVRITAVSVRDTCERILPIVVVGTPAFDKSSIDLYGRPAMTFFAYFEPIPGIDDSCASVAVFRLINRGLSAVASVPLAGRTVEFASFVTVSVASASFDFTSADFVSTALDWPITPNKITALKTVHSTYARETNEALMTAIPSREKNWAEQYTPKAPARLADTLRHYSVMICNRHCNYRRRDFFGLFLPQLSPCFEAFFQRLIK